MVKSARALAPSPRAFEAVPGRDGVRLRRGVAAVCVDQLADLLHRVFQSAARRSRHGWGDREAGEGGYCGDRGGRGMPLRLRAKRLAIGRRYSPRRNPCAREGRVVFGERLRN